MKKLFSWRKIGTNWAFNLLLASSICVMLLVQIVPAIAQSSASTNAEVSNLRTRVNRLEQEVNRLNRMNYRSNTPLPAPKPRNDLKNRAIDTSDPLYDRFATLLIELKEDVRNLDARLTKIETNL